MCANPAALILVGTRSLPAIMKSGWSLRRAWTRTTWLVENNIDFVFVGSRARVDHTY